MNTRTFFSTLAIAALCTLWSPASRAQGQTIEAMPPVVVKTVPASGEQDVAPGTAEIKVTFSKPMTDNSWSWSTAWQNSSPQGLGKPKYETDQKTCVLKVKLEAGKTYAYWINSSNFKGFRDQQGHAGVPYLLIFKTKD